MNLRKLLFPAPRKDRFAQMVMDVLRKSGGEVQPVFDPTEFSITVTNGKLFLNNAYSEYCTVPVSKRKDVLHRYANLSFMAQPAGDFTQMKALLLPRVRDRFYYEVICLSEELSSGKPTDRNKLPPHRLLNDQLLLELVIDAPTSVVSVTESTLKDWGVSFDHAMKVATDNLWAKSKEDFRRVGTGLYASPWKDNHDASRLFLHDLIWQLKVKGDHVAAVPNRDVLLVTGADDAEGLQQMAVAALEALMLPRPMCPRLFRLQGTQWVPLTLPKSHPAYWQVKRLDLMGVGDVYCCQKELLDRIHEKSSLELFVAKYSAVVNKDSPECFSYAVWGEGVDTLLPEADTVVFGYADQTAVHKDFVRIDWGHVREVVGDLMKPQGMYPERYCVQAFPTAAQIAEMKTRQEGSA